MVKHYDLFWKALVLTIAVFLLGVFLGYVLEENRLDEVEETYKLFELEWADIKLLGRYYQNLNPKYCPSAIQENLNFADRIYREGLTIERYEKSNFLTDDLTDDKRKYALLKTEFWLNSIVLKEKCDADYTNLVYFFSDKPEFEAKAQQDAQAKILKSLKNKYGSEMMLIPLPIDMNISVINVIKRTHDISLTPSILVNEDVKLGGVQDYEEVEECVAKKS